MLLINWYLKPMKSMLICLIRILRICIDNPDKTIKRLEALGIKWRDKMIQSGMIWSVNHRKIIIILRDKVRSLEKRRLEEVGRNLSLVLVKHGI